MHTDPFNLNRFVTAQDRIYPQALSEIRRGVKRTHWMWFVFPQLRGLGRSRMADEFGISSIEEAQAYLSHSLLGARLRECVEALQDLTDVTANETFGEVDAIKLRSSLTLFSLISGGAIFEAAVTRWFGADDVATWKWAGVPFQSRLCTHQRRIGPYFESTGASDLCFLYSSAETN